MRLVHGFSQRRDESAEQARRFFRCVFGILWVIIIIIIIIIIITITITITIIIIVIIIIIIVKYLYSAIYIKMISSTLQ